jgi:hypothetical protein
VTSFSLTFIISLQKRKSRGSLLLRARALQKKQTGSNLLVVLVFVDLVAHVIRFFVELPLILLGEVTIVGSHVFLFVILQALLASFQVGRLARCQLILLHSIGDSILLVLFALIDLIHARMAGIDYTGSGAGSVVLGLSSSGSDGNETAHCQDEQGLPDCFGHTKVNPRLAV